jgi:hypothetical protein
VGQNPDAIRWISNPCLFARLMGGVSD